MKVFYRERSILGAWIEREARNIVDYCSGAEGDVVDDLAVGGFLYALRKKFPEVPYVEFARSLGLDGGSLTRYLDASGRPGLDIVFRIAAAAGVSPIDVLRDGPGLGAELRLFEEVPEPSRAEPARRRAPRDAAMLAAIESELKRLMGSTELLPPFKQFARSQGVSAGLINYRFPAFRNAYASTSPRF